MRISKYNSTQRMLLGLMGIVAITIVGFAATVIMRTMSVMNEITYTPTTDRIVNSTPEDQIKLFSVEPQSPITIGECINIKWEVAEEVKDLIISRDSQMLVENGAKSGELTDCPSMPGSVIYLIKGVGYGGPFQTIQKMEVLESINHQEIIPTPTNPPLELSSFTISSTTIEPEVCVLLKWEISGKVEHVDITRNGQSIHEHSTRLGEIEDCPDTTGEYVYQLIASNESAGDLYSPEIFLIVQNPTPDPSKPLVRNWQLVFYLNDQEGFVAAITGTFTNAEFNADGTIIGSSGCNTYSSTYLTNDDNTLFIGRPGSSNNFCGNPLGIMDQEEAYLRLLELSASFHITGNLLEVYNKEQNKILIFIEYLK